jgi:hypothetical protein
VAVNSSTLNIEHNFKIFIYLKMKIMKLFFKGMITVSIVVLMACNGNKKKSMDNQDMAEMNHDTSTAQNMPVTDSTTKQISPAFTQLNPKVSVLIGNIGDHYLHIKNALVNDNHDEAASGAKALLDVLNNADKSEFSSEQKAVYEQQEANLKEDAEHISKTPEIKHQRYHFITLSSGVSKLMENFGGGKTLYVDHCPMANDGKGADWVSEIPEIKNPYLGTKMPTCGIVLEKIK